jgi:hypothetical protein
MESSTGNLKYHAQKHIVKNLTTTSPSLSNFGFAVSTLAPQDVLEQWALFCAEGNRPFRIVNDPALQKLLSPVVTKNRPKPSTISNAIQNLYRYSQRDITNFMREETEGGVYIGTDVWLSPNCVSVLGVVVYYRLKAGNNLDCIHSIPLDFICLRMSHTGDLLASVLYGVFEKFKISERVLGIVTDNASNNLAAMKKLCRKTNMIRFNGEESWIRCFAHIINLISKAVLKRFDQVSKPKSILYESDSDIQSDMELEQVTHFVKGNAGGDELDEEFDEDDEASCSETEAPVLSAEQAALYEEQFNDAMKDVYQGTEDKENTTDKFTTKGCITSLWKFKRIAKLMRYSVSAMKAFKTTCLNEQEKQPHTIPRDVRTRWNSTYLQLESIVRLEKALKIWQRLPEVSLAKEARLVGQDFAVAASLVRVLRPMYDITLQCSMMEVVTISQIFEWVNVLQETLEREVDTTAENYVPAMRNAAVSGLKMIKKYYTLTDKAPIYRMAVVLHPSMRKGWLIDDGWEPDWITAALLLTQKYYDDYYADAYKELLNIFPQREPPTSTVNTASSRMQRLASASRSSGHFGRENPVERFAHGELDFGRDKSNPELVTSLDPIKFWRGEKLAGREWEGLADMALDIFTCPSK